MVLPNVNQQLDNCGYVIHAFLLDAINHFYAYVKYEALWSVIQGGFRRIKDTPQSWSQPAETDHPRTDPGLCVPELSGTVGSLKEKIGNM